jgi:hypothetical protein
LQKKNCKKKQPSIKALSLAATLLVFDTALTDESFFLFLFLSRQAAPVDISDALQSWQDRRGEEEERERGKQEIDGVEEDVCLHGCVVAAR